MGKNRQKTRTTSDQTQVATPYAPIMPGLNNLAQQIGGAVDASRQVPIYQGDFIAQPGQLQNNVIPSLARVGDRARGMIDPLMANANRATTELPSFEGPGLAAGTGSFGDYDPTPVQGVINAAMQPYIRQLTEQILPSIQSSSIESGAYTNDRAFATLPGMALRDTGRMAAEVGSGIAYQDFSDQQNRALQAYGLGTQRGLGSADVLTQRLGMYPELMQGAMEMEAGAADVDSQMAAYDLALRQSMLDNQIRQNDYAALTPFRGLDVAASLYGAFAPYATHNQRGTSTQTVTTQPSVAGQVMQGALGLGSMIGGFPMAGGSSLGANLISNVFKKQVTPARP